VLPSVRSNSIKSANKALGLRIAFTSPKARTEMSNSIGKMTREVLVLRFLLTVEGGPAVEAEEVALFSFSALPPEVSEALVE